MRGVHIAAVMNGWTVKVGCQTLVFNSRSELVRELDAYLADPNLTEKRFLERYGMKPDMPVEVDYARAPVDQGVPTTQREHWEAQYRGTPVGVGAGR